MNNSSKTLVIIVAGATTLAATLGVSLGVMQSRSLQVISQDLSPHNSSQTIAPNATLSQIPQPVVKSTEASTAALAPTPEQPEEAKTPSSVASVTPQSKIATEKTLQPEFCTRANMAIVNDPNPPLNVRSSPRVAANNIVGQLQNGSRVSVVNERNGWLQINRPMRGWVAKNRTEISCTKMRVRISFPSGGNSATVRDRIIGGGEHEYLLRLAKGQTMTLTSNQGPFPTIIAPNGRILAGDPYTDSDRSQWRGRLPLSGDYTLQFESNGEGFEYGFTVQVK